ncbi:MAG: hypothetical protein JXA33_19570 [Anaerolineae bacterium]|nr:hypothetical protein [Anaerolineae bacterium]
MTRQLRYLSYLLRLWQTGDRDRIVWRASLESPSTGARQGFGTLEDLVDFLRAQIADKSERGGVEIPSRTIKGGDPPHKEV